MTSYANQTGFTLIEVLLALAVIAIALTALLKASGQNIENTQRIKNKSISHWVAMQAVSMLQLNLIPAKSDSTQATKLLGQQWYWRIKLLPTPLQKIKQVTVLVSPAQAGPFREEVTAYLYSS